MTLSESDRELLRTGLEQLQLPAAPEQLEWYERYIRELQLWNRRVRLISGSPRDIVIRHILDSLAPWKLVRREMERLEGAAGIQFGPADLGSDSKPGFSIADVGSGNGFPALLLAGLSARALLPPAYYYLVERGAKKAAFLRSTAGLLGLFETVRVEEMDVRQLRRRVDLVVSRAFMPLGEALPLLSSLLGGHGGALLFYAGRRDTVETELARLADLRNFEHEIEPVRVPFLNEERHMCRFYMPLR